MDLRSLLKVLMVDDMFPQSLNLEHLSGCLNFTHSLHIK
ncbi:hypothetical protein SLEP1_g20135 [Rubroshorea leprosula]|uniref:Uncharacterized protein n=1 Tax=Rubroshorea leprosula TaxID=152421 RepID=A0AAV5J7K1_9ROSI|nr:hypothetical protein SLEP1_g20135 [Rubroshorea leprosula]